MGNSQTKGQTKGRQSKKQVHWRAAELPTPPGKPQLVPGADHTPDVVTIRWDRPKRDGGTPVTGYLVEHRRTGSPHWVRATPLLVNLPELTLSGLEPGWRYQFRVSAQNTVGMSEPGEISELLTVTLNRSVITAPKFSEELTETTALENEQSEFVVHVIGQPAPKVCWFKDGFEIFSSRRTRIITDNEKSVLTIYQVSIADEGEIKCTATNKAGHTSTKAALKVEAPPVIRLPRQYEDGLLFELDEVIRLKVSIAGRPQPLIFWAHNGETIQNDDIYEIVNADRSSILRVGEAKRADRGEYQIRAVNKIGEDSTSFLVTVTDKPKPPNCMKVIMTLGKSVTLGWETPEDDGGCKIGNYIVEYYRLGWNVWLKALTCRQAQATLSDLIEGSEYKFRVKAESPYGVSDPSDETDVIFIPDPKRGMMSPPPRSRSQPRDKIRDTSPVAPKRRSTSSTRYKDQANSQVAPIPPKREKLRSPQKSPERSPEPTRRDMTINRNIYDRSSMARELAYGSPDVKYKKSELKPVEQKPKQVETKLKISEPISPEPEVEVQWLQKSHEPNHVNDNNVSPGPIRRERSPSRFNQLLSTILPKRSPSPSPPTEDKTIKMPSPDKRSPEKKSPEKKSPDKSEPIPVTVVEHEEQISSMKGDRFDRLSPNTVNRRLSSPMLDPRSRSPSPDNRNRAPSLGENLVERRNSLTPISRSHSPSPSPKTNERSQSPSRYSIHTDDRSRRSSIQSNQNNNDMAHGSSEFMLVILEDHDNATQEYYTFDDSLIPPPMSLSAPELGGNSPLFEPLKLSASSTELLHERAFARFIKESEDANRDKVSVSRRASFENRDTKARITEIDDRRSSIPKILINSKDNEDNSGLERSSSFTRRLSATTIPQYISAKRRQGLLKNGENDDENDIKSTNSEKMKDITERKLSIPEEKEDINKIQVKIQANHKQLSPVRSPLRERKKMIQQPMIYSDEEESDSEDERLKYDLSPPNIPVQEEDTYHPRMMIPTNVKKYEEPFEILTKPSPLPDPNFVPKPILKKPEKTVKRHSPEKPARKFLRNEPEEQNKLTPRDTNRSRTPSPSPSRCETPIPTVRSNTENQMISAAEAARIKRQLIRRSSEEEYKVVAEHYADLVREYGVTKKYQPSQYLNRDDVKAAGDEEDKPIQEPVQEKKEESSLREELLTKRQGGQRRNPSPCPPRPKPVQVEVDERVGRSRDVSLNKNASKTREFSKTRDGKRNISRNSSKSRDTSKVRDTSKTRDTSKVRDSSNTRNQDRPKTPDLSQMQDTAKTRDVSRTRNISRTRNVSKTRETSRSRPTTPSVLQNKLNTISRTPSPLTPEKQLQQEQADIKVRSAFEYLTDLAMFIVAFWLYLFKDPIFTIPILIIMVYRQLKDEIKSILPAWMLKPKKP